MNNNKLSKLLITVGLFGLLIGISLAYITEVLNAVPSYMTEVEIIKNKLDITVDQMKLFVNIISMAMVIVIVCILYVINRIIILFLNTTRVKSHKLMQAILGTMTILFLINYLFLLFGISFDKTPIDGLLKIVGMPLLMGLWLHPNFKRKIELCYYTGALLILTTISFFFT